MKSVLHIVSIFMMLIAIIGVPLLIILIIFSLIKGRSSKLISFVKLLFVTVPLFFGGLILGTFTEETYWDKVSGQTKEDEKLNKELIENINKNQQKAEEEQRQYEEAMSEEMQATFETPEQRKGNAEALNYKEVRENLDQYVDVYAQFTGEIKNISPTESYTSLDLHLQGERDEIIFVEFPGPVSNYNGDVVTVYGHIGSVNTPNGFIPGIKADIIE